jgi:hypothetical protein
MFLGIYERHVKDMKIICKIPSNNIYLRSYVGPYVAR